LKILYFTKATILLSLTTVSLVSFCTLITASFPKAPYKILGAKTRPTYPLFNFDETAFYRGVSQVKESNQKLNYKVYGGVVTHHILASSLIAEFFVSLVPQDPKTIILVGPNHFDTGKFEALTSSFGWETPFGIVEPNGELVGELVGTGLVQEDEDVFSKEHSIGALVSYIKYYLPGAKLVPIILKPSYELKDSVNLAGVVGGMLGENTVLIASVDFSHYLKSFEAEEKDKTTLAVIKAGDLERLFSFNSDFLDCPGCVATTLLTMENKHKSNLEVLGHTNSGKILGDGEAPTTSYFLMSFH